MPLFGNKFGSKPIVNIDDKYGVFMSGGFGKPKETSTATNYDTSMKTIFGNSSNGVLGNSNFNFGNK